MAYKDKDKQRQAVREATRRYRAKNGDKAIMGQEQAPGNARGTAVLCETGDTPTVIPSKVIPVIPCDTQTVIPLSVREAAKRYRQRRQGMTQGITKQGNIQQVEEFPVIPLEARQPLSKARQLSKQGFRG